MRNPGQPLTIYNIAECVDSAYLKSMTPVNIVNAFKKCGIFPFDDCIFTEVDFMPSIVTDRPIIAPTNQTEGSADRARTPHRSIDSDITVFNDFEDINQEKTATSPSLLGPDLRQTLHAFQIHFLAKITNKMMNCSTILIQVEMKLL